MEVIPGADAPVVDAPVANTVSAPESPTPPVEANPEPVQPRTYTEDEHKQLVDKNVSERLSKERRRLERAVRAEMERDFYKQQVERAQQPQARPQADGRPREQDFAGKPYSEFVEALSEWKADQRFEQKLKDREQNSNTERQQRQAVEQAQAVKERLSEGAEKYPDFEEVALADHIPISHAMAAAIAESDISADVAYYLGSHLKEAERIYNLPPTKQIREIAKIEDKLSATPVPKPAPAPIVPNKGTAPVEVRLEDADFDEFVKIRHKQLAARGKRRR